MGYPKISIITPSYNQGEFIEQTILSVLNQHYPNLEYIIIDGGSTDNSVEIIQKYSDKINYWVSEKDRGQADAINKGFKRASGEIVCWLNSDDTYCLHCFEHVAEAFNKNADVDVIYGDFLYTNEEGRPFYRRHVFNRLRYGTLLFHDYFGQPAVFFKKKVLDKIGFLDETLTYAMDWDFFLRMKRNCKMFHLPKVLATYRIHRHSKTSQEGNMKYAQDCKTIFFKNKVKKFENRILDSSYYKVYYFYSLALRFFTILKDNPIKYLKLKLYLMNNQLSLSNLVKFLLWRLKY